MVGTALRSICFALTMIAVAAPLPAQGVACWSDRSATAAKIRDLDLMLMVSALRCRLTGQDFVPQYNAFVMSSRPALIEVNERLRRHFAGAVGPAEGLDAYDRYVTAIANGYGGGVQGLGCTDMQMILAEAHLAGQSIAGLAALAERTRPEPSLPGGRCNLVIARAP